MEQKFRQRFIQLYANFLELTNDKSEDDCFDCWCATKKIKKRSSPGELLILGSLRYLGRGWRLHRRIDCNQQLTGSLQSLFSTVSCIDFCSTNCSPAPQRKEPSKSALTLNPALCIVRITCHKHWHWWQWQSPSDTVPNTLPAAASSALERRLEHVASGDAGRIIMGGRHGHQNRSTNSRIT